MNKRQRKKNLVNRMLKASWFFRYFGAYPKGKDEWIFPLGDVLKWFPRSASWRAGMRKMGHPVSTSGRFALMCCGIEKCTWRKWLAYTRKP